MGVVVRVDLALKALNGFLVQNCLDCVLLDYDWLFHVCPIPSDHVIASAIKLRGSAARPAAPLPLR